MSPQELRVIFYFASPDFPPGFSRILSAPGSKINKKLVVQNSNNTVSTCAKSTNMSTLLSEKDLSRAIVAALPAELIQTIALHVKKEDEYGFCAHCNWNPSFPHSHIAHGKYQCVYIQLKYEVEDTEEGDYRYRHRNSTEPWTEVCI